ncbi:hypothetical protein [Streptomyces sp. enrichment culture]|uniref:hypothetical protein n=1 Tax=Streptomyces sp. enrichment culture TaxID=1795815 RepID=UPI003F57119A
MTENSEAMPEVIEGAVAEPAVDGVTARVARSARARRVATVAGSVLLAGAMIGGVAYTVVTVQNADRSAGKPAWKLPPAGKAGAPDGGADSEGLSALFLPFEDGARFPGPDVRDFGHDTELSGAKATALRKESLKGLPGSVKRQLAKLIEKQDIKGMALRSYAVHDGGYEGEAFTAEVTLQRMGNRSAVRNMAGSAQRFMESSDVFREAPKVKGHRDARCYLSPKAEKDGLEGAFCVSHVGDVLVNMVVDSPGPVDRKGVTAFFAAQLDRIDNPGLAV